MKETIKILLDISLESNSVTINDIDLIEGKMTGEVNSFLDVLKDTLEGMSEGGEEEP